MEARLLILAIIFGASTAGASDCIGIQEAAGHTGSVKCVAGTVNHIGQSPSGVTFINFCEDYRQCPFTAVVFPRDLRHVGDVRQLAGKQIQVEGKIRQYDGRAEIIVRRARQLGGEITRLPPVPKEFDVERRGRFSAGRYSHPQAARRPAHGERKPDDSGIPAEEPVDDP
jgi:hypothetical protein